MYDITVITPTIGRKSIEKLIKSLVIQKVKILHLLFWDSKRCIDGYNPDSDIFTQYHNENYISYNYIISHPIQKITRIDNYMRSLGIKMATTEYITQIDDDCWLEYDWLFFGINIIKANSYNYCFCKRYLWESEDKKIGMDDYESIGIVNNFEYNLMETNSIVFTKNIANDICNITSNCDFYGHDRVIAKYLIDNHVGIYTTFIGLNQIIPDFLIDFHKKNVTKM